MDKIQELMDKAINTSSWAKNNLRSSLSMNLPQKVAPYQTSKTTPSIPQQKHFRNSNYCEIIDFCNFYIQPQD